MPRIGIIGFKTDSHVRRLAREIAKRGAEAATIDFLNFPRFNLLSIDGISTYDDIHVEQPIELSTIDLLFIRNFANPFPSHNDDRPRFIQLGKRAASALSAQYNLVRMLERRIPVINTLQAMLYHRLKCFQYFVLAKTGLSVPHSLYSNNVEEAKEFASRFPNGAIVKPGTGGAEVIMADRTFFESTQSILKVRPFLFQQYVKGRSLRAYCLGGEVLSIGEIHYDKKYVDWREKNSRIEAVEADENLITQLAKATNILNLPFCSIDIEYDAYTRKYYLLDFSPAPLFLGWSRSTNTDIAGEVAEYLLGVIDNGAILWKDT
jgi:glutathione synthase/RimK-type ligase-like ATP-grasp enzyme